MCLRMQVLVPEETGEESWIPGTEVLGNWEPQNRDAWETIRTWVLCKDSKHS